MKEDFLHFIWQHRLYDASSLSLIDGRSLSIAYPGNHNHSSGPDFSEGRIRIGDTLWVGSIEIHLKSSDWYAHGHQNDRAYDGVVLHVVFEHDREVLIDGSALPTLQLKGRIRKEQIDRYDNLVQMDQALPCASFLDEIDEIKWSAWLDRLVVELLERKVRDVISLLDRSNGDWLRTYATLLAGYLAGPYNKQQAMSLIEHLPFRVLMRYRKHALARESIILGVAGFIPQDECSDQIMSMREEYELRRAMYRLRPLYAQWKTGRLRPLSMPMHRLVQWSGMLPHLEDAYDDLLIEGHFDWSTVGLDISEYWEYHTGFGVLKKSPGKKIGSTTASVLDINVHAPLLFTYGSVTGDQRYKEMSTELLENSKPERNADQRHWVQQGKKARSASQSQALLELTHSYCSPKKCVNCNVGRSIISAS